MTKRSASTPKNGTSAKTVPPRQLPAICTAIARKSLDDSREQAWGVRLSRSGRMIQTTCSDSTYGGERR